ncbi:MAG: hypothetical protein RIQ79_1471 [Verrucomicrobiota bacterium]
MNTLRAHLSILALCIFHPVLVVAGGGLNLLGVEEQSRVESSAPLVAGLPATLQILLPPGTSASDLAPRFLQLAGTIARPLPVEAVILPNETDARVLRLRLTPPAVKRVTRLQLWLGQVGPVDLVVFPPAEKREDLAPLAEALAASRLRLIVCGPSRELRAYLRGQSLEFEDFGADAPEHLAPDTLLLGELASEDWGRLTRDPRAPATARLLAFMSEPTLLPGVYTQAAVATKVTLPLVPLLSTDPRARETLHQLLLQVLPAAPR